MIFCWKQADMAESKFIIDDSEIFVDSTTSTKFANFKSKLTLPKKKNFVTYLVFVEYHYKRMIGAPSMHQLF